MVIRITEPGKPAFLLRKGEDGLSVFDLDAVTPPLTTGEVLACFRPGSQAVERLPPEIEAKGLVLIRVPGADPLPPRVRDAHAEIRPGADMTRGEFKQALKELE